MVELLQRYSLSDILMFIVILALAVKSLISFFDWVYDRLKKVFNKEHCKLSEKEELERRLQHGSEVMTTLKANQEATDKILNDLSAKIDMLIDSDKDDIKSYITKNIIISVIKQDGSTILVQTAQKDDMNIMQMKAEIHLLKVL